MFIALQSARWVKQLITHWLGGKQQANVSTNPINIGHIFKKKGVVDDFVK
jgi:hypothetical protein